MPGIRQVLGPTTGGWPRRVSAASLALAALLLRTSAAWAQPPDSSFDRLAARIRAGEKVVVTGTEGQLIRGNLAGFASRSHSERLCATDRRLRLTVLSDWRPSPTDKILRPSVVSD
jgi:hypothetical protein